jgi:hypothetical protein
MLLKAPGSKLMITVGASSINRGRKGNSVVSVKPGHDRLGIDSEEERKSSL